MKTGGAPRYAIAVAMPLIAALLAACSGSEPATTPTPSAALTGSGVTTPASPTTALISAGGYHTCALDEAGTISCWGLGDYGQLGAGSVETGGGTTPIAAPDGVVFTEVAAGNAHTCAIDTEGSVWCWGIDGDGTHEGENSESHGPQRVALPDGLRMVSIDGYYHSCATAEDGSAWCWGRGEEGQLGDGAMRDSLEPVGVSMPDGVKFTRIVTGAFHTCALDADGAIWCWGQNLRDQLDGASEPGVPGKVTTPEGLTFSSIAAGFSHTCALTTDGAAWCWGEGTDGQLGDGGTSNASELMAVDTPAGITFSAIDAGNAHTCALATDGSVWCWGLGVQGGTTDGANALVPTEVPNPSGASALTISAGGFHSCALLDDGSAWCWGDDGSGQLGDGTWSA